MAVTPFLKLQLPPFDTAPWDQAVNGNMQTIDAFISNFMAVPNYTGQWVNSRSYTTGQTALDSTNSTIYQARVTHISSDLPALFSDDRTTYPGYWVATSNVSTPIVVITVSDTAPANAKTGDLWFDSVGVQLYIRYSDGNTTQWVICNNTPVGDVAEAPKDGHTYARKNGAWVQIA